MRFDPVLPAPVLVVIAVVLLAVRAGTLREALGQVGAGRHVRLLRWTGVTAAVLLMLLAGARPSVGAAGTQAISTGGSDVNVFFVVDRSVDSRVQDFGVNTSRMAGIRRDVATLIDQYPRARFAVISFSSRASLDWPLSDDAWSLKAMIAGLQAYTSAAPDTTYRVNAGAASDVLRYKLQQAQFQFPHSKNLVFYLGEGAGGARAPQGGFDLGSAKVAGGAVLGYGTPAGGPIPQEVVNGAVVYAVDAHGDDLTSALNEPALTAIAGQLGIPYLHRESGQRPTQVVTTPNAVGNLGADAAARVHGPVELYWAFTLAAAAVLLIEIYVTIRQFRRHRLARADVEP